MHRRTFLAASALPVAVALTKVAGAAQRTAPRFSYPIGLPGRPLGDGFFIRHGYACENAAYYPGLSHTGENWYAIAGNAAGAGIFAVAAGEVAYAGYDYPGRVVILRHGADLYSMYGHLDYGLAVAEGETVARGQPLGTVLGRSDDLDRSHLHFEFRTFLTLDPVNGDAPRHGFTCGYRCPPGPGYWPLGAEHPSVLGWRNPTHAIARRAFSSHADDLGTVVVSVQPSAATTAVWDKPSDRRDARQVGDIPLRAGERFTLTGIHAGREAGTGTGAAAYRLWYRLALSDGDEGCVQVAVPLPIDVGLDGRPASVWLDLLPDHMPWA